MNGTRGTRGSGLGVREFVARGFSLLEVILALAILALAMPILAQLAQSGISSAQQAQDIAQATIICESVMAKVVAGAEDLNGVAFAPVEESIDANGDPMFFYSVASTQSDLPGMLAVYVIVENTGVGTPVRVELVRHMIDPEYVASVEEAAAAAAAATTDTGAAATSAMP